MERKIIDFKDELNILKYNGELKIKKDLSEKWLSELFLNSLFRNVGKDYAIVLVQDDYVINKYETLDEAVKENRGIPVFVFDETTNGIKLLSTDTDKPKENMSSIEIVDELLKAQKMFLDGVGIIRELVDEIQKGNINNGQNDKG